MAPSFLGKSDLAPLQERISLLERRHQRRNSSRKVVLLLAAAGAFLAFRHPATTHQPQQPAVVKASAFLLVDGSGNIRGEWKVTDEGDPSFTLLDHQNRKRYEILLKQNEAVFVRMRDGNDQARIIQIVDAHHHPHLLLTDVHQQLKLQMAVAESGAPSLVCFGKDGLPQAGLGVHPDGRPWHKPGPPKGPRKNH